MTDYKHLVSKRNQIPKENPVIIVLMALPFFYCSLCLLSIFGN